MTLELSGDQTHWNYSPGWVDFHSSFQLGVVRIVSAVWKGDFRTFLQTGEVRKSFRELLPLLSAHFVVGGLS